MVKPTDIVGGVTAAAPPRKPALPPAPPVVCSSNDTTVEFFGIGADAAGIGAVKLATAGVLFLATEGPSVNPPISCYPHIIDGLYYTATGTNSCASAHRWLRATRCLPKAASRRWIACPQPSRQARTACSSTLICRGERAPYWDPLLRADFIGLTHLPHPRPFRPRLV